MDRGEEKILDPGLRDRLRRKGRLINVRALALAAAGTLAVIALPSH